MKTFLMVMAVVVVFAGSIALATNNFCSGIVAIVSATPTPPPGSFPQFNTNGTLSTSYSPTTSIFLTTMWFLSFQVGFPAAAIVPSGISAYEDGQLWPQANQQNNDGGPLGCGSGASFSESCYETNWPGVLTAYRNRFNVDHIPYVISTDQAFNQILTNIPHTSKAIQFTSQHLASEALANHDLAAQISLDEVGPDCFTPCGAGTLLDGMGVAFGGDATLHSPPAGCPGYQFTCAAGGASPNFSPGGFAPNLGSSGATFTTAGVQPHVVWGAEPNASLAPYWWTLTTSGGSAPVPSIASDFAEFEATGNGVGSNGVGYNTSITSFKYGILQQFDGFKSVVETARPNTPIYWGTAGEGIDYFSHHNGSPYGFVNGTDTFNTANGSPGTLIDTMWSAVAHGYSGIRVYAYDLPRWCGNPSGGRTSQTNNGAEQGIGTGPIEDWNNGRHCSGQDRWYAQAQTYNLIKTLTPYILQPATTPPVTTPTACYSVDAAGNITNGSSTLICGAKSGNGGRLVIFVNFSDSTRVIGYNPTAYYLGATTANAWEYIGGSDMSCGGGESAYAGTASPSDPATGAAPYDCGRGETNINLSHPTIGTITAAVGAPTTSSCAGLANGGALGRNGVFSGGVCTWTMPALAAYVFLYHS